MYLFHCFVEEFTVYTFQGQTTCTDDPSYPDIQAARSIEQLIALNDSSMKAMSELHRTSSEGTSFTRFESLS